MYCGLLRRRDPQTKTVQHYERLGSQYKSAPDCKYEWSSDWQPYWRKRFYRDPPALQMSFAFDFSEGKSGLGKSP